VDFAKGVCFGFAIVNFISEARAQAALTHFSAGGGRILEQRVVAEWSQGHHGVTALINKYRQSKVMQESVPEMYRPMFLVQGQPRPFPL